MRAIRLIAVSLLVTVGFVAMLANFLAPHDYKLQFRNQVSAPPSRSFLLGTDELGRDRFSRLLKGTSISLICSIAGAVVATAAGTAIGTAAGYFGGWLDEAATATMDLFLSLPWLFAMLTLRALLPIDTSPLISVAATFGILAVIGWAPGARMVRAGATGIRDSQFIQHARGYGCGPGRLLLIHLLPNLRPIVSAQFWSLVPVFLLAEANLGMLGLGVNEPLPSLGNMLSELQNYEKIPDEPWILAPAILLIVVTGSLHFVVSKPLRGEQA